MAGEPREEYRIGGKAGIVLNAPINDTIKTTNPTVGIAAALIVTVPLPGRFFIVIANDSAGAQDIFVSEASYVAISGVDKGKRIPAGQERAFMYGQSIFLFAIASAGGAVVNVLEASA